MSLLSCELRVKHAFPYYVLVLFILDIRARVLYCDLTFFLDAFFWSLGAFFPTPPVARVPVPLKKSLKGEKGDRNPEDKKGRLEKER